MRHLKTNEESGDNRSQHNLSNTAQMRANNGGSRKISRTGVTSNEEFVHPQQDIMNQMPMAGLTQPKQIWESSGQGKKSLLTGITNPSSNSQIGIMAKQQAVYQKFEQNQKMHMMQNMSKKQSTQPAAVNETMHKQSASMGGQDTVNFKQVDVDVASRQFVNRMQKNRLTPFEQSLFENVIPHREKQTTIEQNKIEFSQQKEVLGSPSAIASYGLNVMNQSPRKKNYDNLEEVKDRTQQKQNDK